MAIAPTGASIAQQAQLQTQVQAGAAGTAALHEQNSNSPAAAQAATGAATATSGTAPLASSLAAAAQQSATGAATTTTTTTQTPGGTTTTQQTKAVEEFNAPMLKLPARAKYMDTVAALHVAAKDSNEPTARALQDFAKGLQDQRQEFLTGIINILWQAVSAR